MFHTAILVVAPNGDDNHSGSKEAPFLTINKAQNVVRERIKDGMSQDVTVYLRGGTYFVDATLQFDDRDSGRDGFRVSYRNFPGEVPRLVGGKQISHWEPYKDSIWKTKVGQGWSFHTLYADGDRIPKARLPANGYFQVEGQSGESYLEGFKFHSNEIPFGSDLTNSQVFIWPGRGEWNWFSEMREIDSIDYDQRFVRFKYPSIWDIGVGSRYYIQGSLHFLQSPGQFHLDETEGWLYYRPKSGKPLHQKIIAPTVTRLIELKGSDHECQVQHLTFSGLNLSCTDFFGEYKMIQEEPGLNNVERDEHREGLIYINYAADIEISHCQIGNSGSCGIFMDHYAQNITMAGNHIEHLGYIGICASGFSPIQGSFTTAEASYTNKGHRITNNYIKHGGELVGHGCGILLYQSGDNDISHNTIAHMPRYGISLKGLRHKVMTATLYGIPVTWENHWDFLHTRNNHIAYNDISNVMTDSQDGGLLESWGVGTGNVIHSNHLHHSGIHFSYGFGIYLDDASDYFTVTNNVLSHLYSTGEGKLWMLIFSKGIGNRIQGNLLVSNPHAIAAIGTQEMAGEENKEIVVDGNIVYNSGYLYYFVNWRKDKFAAADRNLYWKDEGPCKVAGKLPLDPCGQDRLGRSEYDWEAWRSLLNGKFDGHTLITDPLFIHAAEGDYRLQPNSPAYRLGWVNIDYGKIGPQ
ncbi:right-handed parallel beta-helix repeat-containing protein [Paenibacillus sp. V4I5]|uniref:right-handed parallel beta-helix repeat-containing protein n=1 Tax=Paenibacillus sp. V4I5 TaxID=3042306 RepID=UPI002791C1FD|nr:right-handed parallel beta-helix repeat-containing protein [Paenibacillus sp. V4I5]MDQ0914415.1 hypothetical protein [Paenibacillus sp. V4I5]